jgi:DNA-binding response OmpR family regulator
MVGLSESSTRPARRRPVRQDHAVVFGGETRRILVVDDNRDWADALAVLLLDEGFRVRAAYDGSEALGAAREFRPHVVVLDIRMPNLNGFEAAQVFSRHPSNTRPVLIAVTAWPHEAGRQLAARSGFDHYLAKPAAMAEVVELLKKV